MKIPVDVYDLYKRLDIRGKRIAVLFSGGADSVYMVETLRAYECRHLTLHFINYLNTPAAPEAELNLKVVRNYAYGTINGDRPATKLIIHDVDIEADYNLRKGPEGNCRVAKKDVINQLVASDEYDYVFVGHNLDDHVETVLIQLMRGAGRGTRGIPDMERGKVVRPLIHTKKEDIVHACHQYNLPYFEDPINKNLKGTRAFFRHEIIPKLVEHYGSGAYGRICNIGKKFEELMGDEPDGTAA